MYSANTVEKNSGIKLLNKKIATEFGGGKLWQIDNNSQRFPAILQFL